MHRHELRAGKIQSFSHSTPSGRGASDELLAVIEASKAYLILSAATLLAVAALPLGSALHLTEPPAWLFLVLLGFGMATALSRVFYRAGPARAPLAVLVCGAMAGATLGLVASTWLGRPQACVFVGMVAMVAAFFLIVMAGYVRITCQVLPIVTGLKCIAALAGVLLAVGALNLPAGPESLLLTMLLVAFLLALGCAARLVASGFGKRAAQVLALLGVLAVSLRVALLD